jgi:hypothetical protein
MDPLNCWLGMQAALGVAVAVAVAGLTGGVNVGTVVQLEAASASV